jgi:hypothetical protein
MLHSANGQTPGYMGKHLTIGYSNNFFPALIGPTAKSQDVGINATHSFNLEYTIKNRTNLCVSYQRLKTGVDFNYELSEEYVDQYGSYENALYRYRPKSRLPSQLISNNICLGLKFFNSGALAPVGKYRKFELVLLFPKLTYESNAFVAETYSYNYDTTYTLKKNIGTGEYSFKSFALTYTFGRQRVLFDRIVLDYGFQLGVHPIGMLSYINSDLEFTTSSNVGSYSRALTNQRLLRYESFNFHIGLGLLAF